jgi:hypothetical protein
MRAGIKHANPYVIGAGSSAANFCTAVFPWDRLLERGGDVAHKILGLCGSRVFAYRSDERRCPEALRPRKMPSYVPTQQILEIERSRADIEGHGPKDKLTVTFSDVVRRGLFFLEDQVAQAHEDASSSDDSSSDGSSSDDSDYPPLDVNAVCAAISAAMDHKQTWTDVSKIRLVRGRAYLDDQCTRYYVELVRQGTDGEETVRIEHGFSLTVLPGYTPVQVFARRLREELHLRHAFVDGVEEYAV